MNIFFLDKNPQICATMHCDKHVVKMIIEYAQLLSTAHRVLDGNPVNSKSINNRKYTSYNHPTMNDVLYKATMKNHPSAIWVRESKTHYEYLYTLWVSLCNEYTHRYNKIHSTYSKLKDALSITPKNIPVLSFSEPPPAMKHFPQCIVPNNSIQSYHNYYRVAKAYFAKWTNRSIPDWYLNKSKGLEHANI
jgi:hypothetical protein